MARFFVGQRVRVIGADKSKFLIGLETFVTGPLCIGTGVNQRDYEGYPTSLINVYGRFFIARPEQLEPILDSGHEPAELDVHELLPFLKEMETVK